MELDDRLKKIATGVSVTDAIDAYMTELVDRGEDIDPEKERVDELLAIVEIMFLMAAVDGEVSTEEVQELQASVNALTDIAALEGGAGGGVQLDQVMKDFGEKLARDGWKARLESACSKVRAPESRSFAFQLAAGVAFVDDFVAHAEAAAIDSVAQALGIEKNESQMLLRDVHASLFGE